MWITLMVNEGSVPDAGFANSMESGCWFDSSKDAHSDGAGNLLQEAESRFEVPMTSQIVWERNKPWFQKGKEILSFLFLLL